MQEAKGQVIGGHLPEIALNSLDGVPESLAQRLTGKKGAVVIFWSGVCSHCTRYDDYLNTFAQRHPELGFIAIASRNSETEEMIRKSIADRGLRFPILVDPTSAVAAQWFTQQTPRAFLLDRDRTLLYRGAIDNFKYPEDPAYLPYLENAIEEFLSGSPLSRTETASFGCAIKSVYYVLPRGL